MKHRLTYSVSKDGFFVLAISQVRRVNQTGLRVYFHVAMVAYETVLSNQHPWAMSATA